jgi:hypothetical protein
MVDRISDGWFGPVGGHCRRLLESPNHREYARPILGRGGETAFASEYQRRDFLKPNLKKAPLAGGSRHFQQSSIGFQQCFWLRIAGIQSMFMTGRKELRKPIEISTVEFVVQQNGIA